MGFKVLHGILLPVGCWRVPISKFKEAMEWETRILTEVDSRGWINLLPFSDGMDAYDRYFGKAETRLR
jgi:hypothetical protein